MMSYLIGPRLHFAGTFAAEVSTVNNLPAHFDDPNNPARPGWNPGGNGSWTLKDCKIRSAVFTDGTVARTSADDPIVGASVVQLGRAVLVDLDPQQQMVSQIWGLRLGITSAAGASAMTGGFKVAAFSDIWGGRLPNVGSDRAMSAFYQSVIAGISWSDLFGSRLLSELKQASDPTSLSIKFNVDGFDRTKHTGRIVGSIGPASADEPAHFVVGRQCMGHDDGPVWYFPAVVDGQRRKLIADFGNALQTPAFGGPFDQNLDLSVGLRSGNQFISFGRIPIGPDGWYEQTAGICEFPSDRPLSNAEMAQLGTTPIAVVQQTDAGRAFVAGEGSDGLHVRADDFVYRMSANDTQTVSLRVSRFGQPLPNAAISVAFDPSQLQGGPTDPDVNDPLAGVSFPSSIVTDANGIASLKLSAGSLAEPRKFPDGRYIDGQVYGVRYTLPQSDPNAGGYFDRADFISVLVWTDYAVPNDPDWSTHVEPILSQYQKLYSVMTPIVNLGDYASVVAHKAGMQNVFTRPEDDPHYMPVTRDLSPAKRKMILSWLDTTGNGGKPNLGPQIVVAAHAPDVLAEAAQVQPQGELVDELEGKTAALRNRVGSATQPRGFVKRPL
jgi:hypothetical protein